MAAPKKPLYSRVVIKISGEMLRLPEGSKDPIDRERLQMIASQLQAVAQMGVQIAVVVGGGNIVRGAKAAEDGAIERVTADHMGMLSTIINGLALMDTLEKIGVETRVMSAIPIDRLAEPYILRRATRHLDKGRVLILVAGTGNPYFSTDTAAALRASEIGAQILLKGTKVDGIYSDDPVKNPAATRYDQISFAECIEKRLHVMDATAFALCQENKLPVLVFDLLAPDAIKKILLGERVGTKVV